MKSAAKAADNHQAAPPITNPAVIRGLRFWRGIKSKMERPAVTAILNAHREGLFAKPSIESLKRSAAHAAAAGHEVEVIIILDMADSLTKEVVLKCALPSQRIHETSFGDLGTARNFALSQASGDYVAFLDADDLWGVNWLTEALAVATERQDRVIWHPEINVYFQMDHHIFLHVDMESQSFNAAGLLISNYWTSLSFGARQYYIDNPYPKIDLSAGLGFEDWAWNMETISRGFIHKVVRGTGHLIRRKEYSLAKETVAAQAVPRPNFYLRGYIEGRTAESLRL